MDTALVLAVSLALAFAFTNGFMDAANAIATLVATRAATPFRAILLAAAMNMLGPLLLGAAVASTIAGIVTVPDDETVQVVGAGLTAAVAWNVLAWTRGTPSSSGHALLGGLVGAALFEGGGDAVNWGGFDGVRPVGVLGTLAALAIAPVLGVLAALVTVRVLRLALRRGTRRLREPVVGAEWAMSALLAFSHGANDAQKGVGVIAALLLAAGQTSTLSAPVWATLGSAGALTLGTALGGWKIVKTIGRRIYDIRPVDALSSQTASAVVIFGASIAGAPVSTTHVVASSVVGAGGGRRRWRHVDWTVVREIGVVWLTTIPATAALAAVSLVFWRWIA